MKQILFALALCLPVTHAAFGKNTTANNTKNFSSSPSPSFIENKGQVRDQYHNLRGDIQFQVAATPGLNIFIGEGAIHYQFCKVDKPEAKTNNIEQMHTDNEKAQMLDMYRMDVTLIGADKNAPVVAEEKQQYYESYFNEHTNGRSVTAHTYNRITYKNVYPNIDWIMYMKGGHLKHEFVVRPGGKVADIKIKYGGATELKIDAGGRLVATTPQGKIVEDAPVSQQEDGTAIQSKFQLSGDILTYKTSNYTGALTIDPLVAWGTYHGAEGQDEGLGLTTSNSGFVYLSGQTNSASGVATTGAYQFLCGGDFDVYLVKFDANGIRQWSTYYGGPGDDNKGAIAVDGSDNIYITGYTVSLSGIATPGAYQTVNGGITDAFLAKFNTAGSIQWATYYGNIGTDNAWGVATDAAGNAYICGVTNSTTGISTAGAHQPALGGNNDALLIKFNAAGTPQWATYYGGTGNEKAENVRTDLSGNIYMTGNTNSAGAIASAGAHQTTYGGGTNDAFLVKFNTAGTRLWGTYFGGTLDDKGFDIATDGVQNVYMCGTTLSTTGIATPGAHRTTFNFQDGFLVKMNSAGVTKWSTYVGGNLTDFGRGVVADLYGNVFTTGYTSSTTGIATPGAHQPWLAGSYDAYLQKFDTMGNRLMGTYYGGSDADYGYVLSATPDAIYLTGNTISTSGLTTAGSHQPILADIPGIGNGDAFLVKMYNCSSPSAGTITGASKVCAGSSITLSNSVGGGTWSASNTRAIVTGGTVTGIAAGADTIQYLVADVCGYSTAVLTVTITAIPDPGTITGGPSSLCPGATASLTNATGGGVWSASNTRATVTGGLVTAVSTGTDTVIYSVTNSNGCTDTAAYIVTVLPLPEAGTISGPSLVCMGSPINLTDAVAGGTWSVSNTNASVSGSGIVTGLTPGTTTIVYSVSNSCGTDTANRTITVTALPDAGNITGLSTVCAGTSITLTDPVSGGIWSTSNTRATVSGGVVAAFTAGADTVIYTISNSCGTDAATHIITVLPQPDAGAISGPSLVCVGSVIALTDPVAAGIWSASNANATVTSTGAVTGLIVGTDTIIYSVSNSCGTDTANLIVTVATLPDPGIISGTSWVCPGTTTTLTDPIAGGIWSASNTLATVSGSTVTGVAAGINTVTYSVSNSCGTSAATYTMSIIPMPDAGTLSGPIGMCMAATTALSYSVSGGVWSASNPKATVNSSGVVTAVNTGTVTIVYSYTNSCGTATSSHGITILQFPNAGLLNGPSSLCSGSTIALSNSAAGGTWSASNINASVSGGVVTGMHIGTTTISYLVTNICGTDVATHDITVEPAADAGVITGSTAICVGEVATLSNAVSGGIWSSTNAGSAVISGTGIVIGIAPGATTIKYMVTNSCGVSTASMVLFVVSDADCLTKTGTVTPAGGMELYPNPVQGALTITSHETIEKVLITNMLGQKVFAGAHNEKQVVIPMMHLPAGVYLVRINEHNVYKVTKQ